MSALKHHCFLFKAGIILIFTIGFCAGGKILMLPLNFGSHVMEMTTVGAEMVARGHEVSMLLEAGFTGAGAVRDAGVEVVLHSPSEDASVLPVVQAVHRNIFRAGVGPQEYAGAMMEAGRNTARAVLENAVLMQTFRDSGYNLAVVDGMPWLSSLYIIPHNLSIPHVSMFSDLPGIDTGIPSLPSFSTNLFSTFSPSNMDFRRKLTNIYMQAKVYYLKRYHSDANPETLARFAPGVTSTQDLVRRSALFIATRDHVLEWPGVTLPNIVRTPGLTTRPGRPLKDEFKVIMDAAQGEGVIVMSFGSQIESIPLETLRRFLRAFRKLRHMVIIRVSAGLISHPNVQPGGNVKLFPWIPQQDLLAHPKTRLFITHCGNNGQYEAAYHGVPMLGFPLFAEQPHNCFRIRDKGLGECLDIHTATPEDIAAAVEAVTHSQEVRRRVEHLGRILRAMPPPKETIASALEHVMEFGADHMKSSVYEMPLYELLMLDLLLVMLILAFLLIAILYLTCKLIFKLTKSVTSLRFSMHTKIN